MKLQNIRYNLGTAIWSLRQSVSGIFMKPSFIIIGAQKSGTGSLYTYLSKHPDIVQPFNKEIHYFDNGVDPSEDNYSKGKSWYRARFPCRLLYLNKLTFEASPAYLFHPEVPERIYRFNPHIRLIALLRNPVERAISQYFMNLRRGFESRPIMQALTEEDALMEKRIRNREFDKRDFALYSYKYRGHYADQIRNYLQYFNPDQIYSASTEAVFTDPVNSLNKMFAFLGIRQEVNLGKVHPINTGYNKESVEREVYEYLEDYFKPLNEDLYHLVGKRFSW